MERSELNFPGIYVLLDGNKYLYVGQSTNIKRRLKYYEDKKEIPINFDVVVIKIEDEKKRQALETQLIKKLCPPLNGKLNAGGHSSRGGSPLFRISKNSMPKFKCEADELKWLEKELEKLRLTVKKLNKGGYVDAFDKRN